MCAYWCSSGIHCHVGKCECTADVFYYGIAVDIQTKLNAFFFHEACLGPWQLPFVKKVQNVLQTVADTFGNQIVYISFSLALCTIC